MSKKKIVGEGLLLGILVYAVFILFLYLRMKNAESALADYNKRLCPSSFDCRNIVEAEIIDYGSSKVSFTNYGPKGVPLESGSFEKYVFKMLIENSDEEIIVVLPNVPSDLVSFDIENIYIPSKSDVNILNGNLFKEKDVYVETWRGKTTFILITSNANTDTQSNEGQATQATLIVPSKSLIIDSALPTENHPVILAEFARNNFIGWTGGILFMILSSTIFSIPLVGIIYGIDWLITRWRKQ
ncbi:MAG: hypothetical protein ACOYYF_11650 [Chloroflexota bacterium]|nr:hypothetical protein [Chloroflexota bacterium]MBI5702384.1 hypothetical protein [Chloroflexota bacterium]